MAAVGSMNAGLKAAGITYSAISAWKDAKSQKAMLRYQAKVAENNAQVAEWQAQQEQEVGASMEQASRLRTGQIYGAQRAAMAANGIDLGEGVATDVLTATRYLGERDALTIRDNAARNAWALRIKKQNYLDDAAVSRASASAISPGQAVFGSLLGNAGAVSDSYKTFTGG